MAKPKSVGRSPLTSVQDSPPSSLRITSQCFCMNTTSGRDGLLATWWTQCRPRRRRRGCRRSGGHGWRAARSCRRHRSRKTPAAEMATSMRARRRWMEHDECASTCYLLPDASSGRSRGIGARQRLPGPAAIDERKSAACSTPAWKESGSISDGSRCQARARSHGWAVPSPTGGSRACRRTTNSSPTCSHGRPPSSDDGRSAQTRRRLGSIEAVRLGRRALEVIELPPAEEWPVRRSKRSRRPSEVRMEAPFLIPTSTRTRVMGGLLARTSQPKTFAMN